jgi:hypothetical protein
MSAERSPKSDEVQISSTAGTSYTTEAPVANKSGITELELRLREVLVKWLRWNEAYEQATNQLFLAGASPAQVEDFMDSMDQLRREAVALSHALLD